jgi:hypothetical protein
MAVRSYADILVGVQTDHNMARVRARQAEMIAKVRPAPQLGRQLHNNHRGTHTMPRLQGKEVISDVTDRSARRLIIVSGTVILIKLYDVELKNLSILGVQLPSELFGIVGLILLGFGSYSLTINWAFELVAFRIWYSEREIWSFI